jgi:mono/diheme cytochrome c family protein
MDRCLGVGGVLLLATVVIAGAGEPAAVERGRKALLEHSYNPTIWSARAYGEAWRQWPERPKEKPLDYDRAFAQHYGLHPAPFANPYPMGLRATRGLFGPGLSTDCLLCHGGSIAGKSYLGLGNASLDMQALYEDLAAADGRPPQTPFRFSNVRGTSEAGAMAVYLLGWREPDLRLHAPPVDLGLRDDLCEDVPAWWLLKKKKSMYYTGSNDARSVRSLMQFMMSPFNTASTIKNAEAAFADIQQFILSLEPPRYPFAIDQAQAGHGKGLFHQHCSRCHGTYGKDWTYPNKIVPLDVIGTDSTRFEGLSRESGRHFNRTWFAHERSGWLTDDFPAMETAGYQAPPLDGVWATAPYFHNGSVPTVYHVLNSRLRPRFFTRSFRTEAAEYDPIRLGWRVEILDHGADPGLPAIERRKVYDSTLPGRGNGGHPFGDDLTEDERMAVIEYLKTL